MERTARASSSRASCQSGSSRFSRASSSPGCRSGAPWRRPARPGRGCGHRPGGAPSPRSAISVSEEAISMRLTATGIAPSHTDDLIEHGRHMPMPPCLAAMDLPAAPSARIATGTSPRHGRLRCEPFPARPADPTMIFAHLADGTPPRNPAPSPGSPGLASAWRAGRAAASPVAEVTSPIIAPRYRPGGRRRFSGPEGW